MKSDKRLNPSGILNELRMRGKLNYEDAGVGFGVGPKAVRDQVRRLSDQHPEIKMPHGQEEASWVDDVFRLATSNFTRRLGLDRERKVRIARDVVKLISDSVVLALGPGSTVYFVAKELAFQGKEDLSIVTYNLPALMAAMRCRNVRLVVGMGGSLDLEHLAFVQQNEEGGEAEDDFSAFLTKRLPTPVASFDFGVFSFECLSIDNLVFRSPDIRKPLLKLYLMARSRNLVFCGSSKSIQDLEGTSDYCLADYVGEHNMVWLVTDDGLEKAALTKLCKSLQRHEVSKEQFRLVLSGEDGPKEIKW